MSQDVGKDGSGSISRRLYVVAFAEAAQQLSDIQHGAEDAGNHGVRAARVIAKSGCHIEAERTTPDERIFPKEWPQFGHCAAVLHEGHVYCLGGVKQQNYMARMKHGSDPSRRSSYEYWTKSGWAQDISGIDDLVAVLSELGQGEIVSMPGRGPGGSGLMMLGVSHDV